MGAETSTPAAKATRGTADTGVALGIGICSAFFFCRILSDSANDALSLDTMRDLLLGSIPIALLAVLVGMTSPIEVRATMAYFRQSRRWRNHHCPRCDHTIDPTQFDGVCPECGSPFGRPKAPPRRTGRRIRASLIAIGVAALVAMIWQAADLSAFRSKVDGQPQIRHSRARWWPAESAGFVYEPGRGISAHD
ncbi:MAG: hypothetical protein JNL80_11590 [Phycisphaerae bacterium]|nr:hypothetical protein [Phycisphaerae bacterium]